MRRRGLHALLAGDERTGRAEFGEAVALLQRQQPERTEVHPARRRRQRPQRAVGLAGIGRAEPRHHPPAERAGGRKALEIVEKAGIALRQPGDERTIRRVRAGEANAVVEIAPWLIWMRVRVPSAMRYQGHIFERQAWFHQA